MNFLINCYRGATTFATNQQLNEKNTMGYAERLDALNLSYHSEPSQNKDMFSYETRSEERR